MSKTALKKELELMDAPQLRQMILDAYDARKEVKEYLEFFLNPDVERMIEKQSAIIAKELNRVKWGRSRARVTNIKRAIKDFTSLNPGPEACLDMIFRAIEQIGVADNYVELTPTIERLVATLAADFIDTADKTLMADKAAARLDAFMRNDTYRAVFRRFIAQSIGRL